MSGRSVFVVLLVVVTVLPGAFVLSAATGGMALPALSSALPILILISLVHVPATFHLLLSDPDARAYLWSRPGLRIGVPIALLVLMPLGMAVVPDLGVPLLLIAFFAYRAWHFGRQNLGVLAFAAIGSRSAPLSNAERATVNAATAVGVLSVTNPAIFGVQGFSLEPLLAVVPPLRDVLATVHLAGLLSYIVLIAAGIFIVARQQPPRSVAEVILFFASVMFFLPVYLSQNPLIAFWSYAIAHAAQYLLFLAFHATGWSWGFGRNEARIWRRGLLNIASLTIFAVSAVLLLKAQHALAAPVSIAVTSAVNWMRGQAPSPRLVARVALSVAPAVTLTHFWLDQHLWRLREPSRRAWVRDRYAFLFS